MIEIQTLSDVDRALQQLQDRVARDSKLFPVPGELDPAECMRIARLIQQIDDDSMRNVLARMTGTYDREIEALEGKLKMLENVVIPALIAKTDNIENQLRIQATNAPR